MRTPKKIYVVGSMQRKNEIAIGGGAWVSTISFTGLADGCCGVLPCFTNRRKAKKYVGKRGLEIIEMERA